MSDYLTNLAARTLAPPSLRPRLRMRFEPEAAHDLAAPVAQEAPVTPRSAAPAVEATTPESLRETSVASARHIDEPQPAVQPPAERIVEQHATPADQPLRHPEERSDEGSLPRTTAATERSFVAPLVRMTETTTTHVVHEHEREKTILHRNEIEPPRVSESPRITPATPMPPPPRPRGVAPVQNARPLDEPAIEISIGRIEVRAAAPAARSAPPAKRPVMTIDDYVARRKDRR